MQINRHHLRIDATTQAVLEQICRYTFSTKSSLMRRYVQEGVQRDAQEYAAQIESARRARSVLASA